MQRFIKEHLREIYLKRIKEGESGHREKLTCNAVATEASNILAGALELRWLLQLSQIEKRDLFL